MYVHLNYQTYVVAKAGLVSNRPRSMSDVSSRLSFLIGFRPPKVPRAPSVHRSNRNMMSTDLLNNNYACVC